MKKFRGNMSLGGKILGIFGVLNCFIVACVVLYLYGYFRGIVNDYVMESVDSVMESNYREVENLLENIEISIDLLNENDMCYSNKSEIPELAKMIVFSNEKANETKELLDDYNKNLKVFNGYFQTCLGNEDNYLNILYIDDKWTIHKFAQKRGIVNGWSGFSSNQKIKNEMWYQEAEARNGECYWFYEENSGTLCLAKLLKLRYMETQFDMKEETLGMLFLRVAPSMLLSHMNMDGLTDHSNVLIYTQEQKLLYQVNPEVNPVLAVSAAEGLDSTKKLSAEKTLPLGLRMVTEVSARDIYEMTSGVIRVIILIGILMAVMIALLGAVLIYTVILPLKRFTKCMEMGTFEGIQVNENREDEIGVLFKTYNRLMTSIETSLEKEKRAELRALQAQINPHFMYNTLNSISGLALLNDQKQISDMIGWLTKIMRYRISYNTCLVTIAEELEIIRQYEHIQEYCYGGCVRFDYDIDERVESALIPKLMIQPLVENALLHGCNPQESVVEVCIKVKAEEEFVKIEIQDNGTEADIEKINQHLNGTRKDKNDSIGIHNIYERIRLEFGEAAQILYRKSVKGYTVAVIKIPIKMK